MQVAATPTKEQMAMKAAVDMPEFSYVCKFVLQHIPLEFFTSPPPLFLLQCTIKILKSAAFFFLPEAGMNIECMNLLVSPLPSKLLQK